MAAETNPRPFGERFTVLRHLNRLTQGALAERLKVTQSFLSYVEKGARTATDEMVHTATREFAVPTSFFYVAPLPFTTGPATFRKTSRVTVKDEARVTALYDEAARMFRALSVGTNFRTAELPSPADFGHDPEEIAGALRLKAGLTETGPVPNATRALERLGFGVIDRLDDERHEGAHLGISRPSRQNDRPLVALAEEVPGAVKRLTVLHEAYHLMADRDLTAAITSVRSPEERRAYRFAGSFLLPAEVARSRISESLSLHGYLPIKAEYGISVGAIIRRGADLNLLSSHRQRSLNIQLSSQGWKRNEPVDVADERPLLVGQALRKLFGAGAVAKASHSLGMAPELIQRWTGADAAEVDFNKMGDVVDLASLRGRRSS